MVLDWAQWLAGIKEGRLVIPTKLLVANPFDAVVRIVNVGLWVTFNGKRVAKLFEFCALFFSCLLVLLPAA